MIDHSGLGVAIVFETVWYCAADCCTSEAHRQHALEPCWWFPSASKCRPILVRVPSRSAVKDLQRPFDAAQLLPCAVHTFSTGAFQFLRVPAPPGWQHKRRSKGEAISGAACLLQTDSRRRSCIHVSTQNVISSTAIIFLPCLSESFMSFRAGNLNHVPLSVRNRRGGIATRQAGCWRAYGL